MDLKNLVQSETGKEVAAALATVHDLKVALPKFFQSQRDRGHCPHECGIHHRATFQIKDKLAVTAVDHFLRELLKVPAIEEVPFAFHTHPNGGTVNAHLNR